MNSYLDLLQDPNIRKSVEKYVKLRLSEIPSEINQSFPNVGRVWKCDNEVDFLYGYYVGKIEEASIHYLLKATRASLGGFDSFEIRGIIETFKKDLLQAIKKSLD